MCVTLCARLHVCVAPPQPRARTSPKKTNNNNEPPTHPIINHPTTPPLTPTHKKKVPLPPVDERRKVVEDVDKDRRLAIDAAVVRTMKSRKLLQHQQLMLEVVQQVCMRGGGGRGGCLAVCVFVAFGVVRVLACARFVSLSLPPPPPLTTLPNTHHKTPNTHTNKHPPPKKTKLSRTFKPDFKLIKKRIEDLIAREYLERDKDNPQIFKYLA